MSRKRSPAHRGSPAVSETLAQARQALAAIDALGVKYNGVAIDSRKVKPGDLFIAYPGATTDGRSFIPQALAAGAVMVAWDPSGFEWNPEGLEERVRIPTKPDGISEQEGGDT